jgi:hypothetical protein
MLPPERTENATAKMHTSYAQIWVDKPRRLWQGENTETEQPMTQAQMTGPQAIEAMDKIMEFAYREFPHLSPPEMAFLFHQLAFTFHLQTDKHVDKTNILKRS